MLILQMPPRVVSFKADALPSFPAPVMIHVELEPKEVFGEAKLSGRLPIRPPGEQLQVAQGSTLHGGMRVTSVARLSKLSVAGPFFDASLEIEGSLASITFECLSPEAFTVAVKLAETTLPAILSAAVAAPVEAANVYGHVGEHFFELQFQGAMTDLILVDGRSARIQAKLDLLRKVPQGALTRIVSSHRYLLQARRLRYVSSFQSQFLGERLLNLCKAVEVLFGKKTTELRPELGKLGLRDEVIEMVVGLIYVRDESDVGHPALTPLSQDQFETVHGYAVGIEEIVAWLIDHVFEAANSGRIVLKGPTDKPPKRERTLTEIAKLVKSVNPLQPRTFLRSEVSSQKHTTVTIVESAGESGGKGGASL